MAQESASDLERRLALAQRALSEALERAGGDRRGASHHLEFPGELEPVFQAMLASATRICEAKCGTLLLFEEGQLRLVAMHGAPREFEELRRRDPNDSNLCAPPRRDKGDRPRCRDRGRISTRKFPAGKTRGGTLVHLGANAKAE